MKYKKNFQPYLKQHSSRTEAQDLVRLEPCNLEYNSAECLKSLDKYFPGSITG